MASNSSIDDFRPFIFQLPAIKGRIGSVMSEFSPKISHTGLPERGGQFQIGASRAVNRFTLPALWTSRALPAKVATRRLPLYDALSTR
jgi:hypothetical protein